MTEPTITCPKCKAEIKLTESLAAPLIESTRREYEQRLSQKEADIVKREEAISRAKESIETQVADKIRQERSKIVAEEAKKAQIALATDLEQRDKEINDDISLHQLMEMLAVKPPFAVELNRKVCPKRLHKQTILNPGDVLEIVTIVGGG